MLIYMQQLERMLDILKENISLKYTKSFDKTLKKYPNEITNLNSIIELLRLIENFEKDIHNPLLKMYGFEKLKHYENLYSFNLNKNGGVIRLIIKYDEKNKIIYLAYISFKHYKDFLESKVIYYDE